MILSTVMLEYSYAHPANGCLKSGYGSGVSSKETLRNRRLLQDRNLLSRVLEEFCLVYSAILL